MSYLSKFTTVPTPQVDHQVPSQASPAAIFCGEWGGWIRIRANSGPFSPLFFFSSFNLAGDEGLEEANDWEEEILVSHGEKDKVGSISDPDPHNRRPPGSESPSVHWDPYPYP